MVALSHRHPAVGFFVFFVASLNSISTTDTPTGGYGIRPYGLPISLHSARRQLRRGGVTPPYILPKKENVGRPDLWPPCPFAPSCTIRAAAPHTPGTPRGTAPQRKASLVKGRWTPQADGGIPTGYALCAVTPADGQESLRLAGSAPPFDKGGFSAPTLNFTSNFTLAKYGKVCYNLIAYRFSGKYSRNPKAIPHNSRLTA